MLLHHARKQNVYCALRMSHQRDHELASLCRTQAPHKIRVETEGMGFIVPQSLLRHYHSDDSLFYFSVFQVQLTAMGFLLENGNRFHSQRCQTYKTT